jgi:hypothetical protein
MSKKRRNDRRVRTPHRDSATDLISRLAAYSTAAGATLAFVPTAKAAIFFTATNMTLVPSQSYMIDITGGTNAADPTFEIVVQGDVGANSSHATFNILRGGKGVMGRSARASMFYTGAAMSAVPSYWSLSTNALLLAKISKTWHLSTYRNWIRSTWVKTGTQVNSTWVSAYTTSGGAYVSGHSTFVSSYDLGHSTPVYTTTTRTVTGSFSSNGAFASRKGIIAVRFMFNGGLHYGWIAFDAQNLSSHQATITGWAYEGETNMAITAGATFRAPLRNAANLTFDDVQLNSMAVHWVPGDGNRRIVVARADTPVTWTPSDGVEYPANTNFSMATSMDGHRVVYAGTGDAVTIDGLDPKRLYYFKVFEYGGTGADTTYLTDGVPSPATNSQQTLQYVQFTQLQKTGGGVELRWTSNPGKVYRVLRTTNIKVDFAPIAENVQTNSYPDAEAPAAGAFYRVEERDPE